MGSRTEQLTRALERAGLERVGTWYVDRGMPPNRARRLLAWAAPAPAAVLPRTATDAFREEWRRLAYAAGLADQDGVVLVDGGQAIWAYARLDAEADPYALLDDGAGDSASAGDGYGFQTMSTDGETLLAVTVAGEEIRLSVLDRLSERNEEAAREAVRETAQEREAAWASLFEPFEKCATVEESVAVEESMEGGLSERLRHAWARGLARNKTVPAHLRHGLLGLNVWSLYGALPPETIEAALTHPEWRVRATLAEVHPHLTGEHWERLILGEEPERHRWILALLAAERRAEVSEEACRQLAADPSTRVRQEAARLTGLPVPVRRALAADSDGTVRANACPTAWPYLDDAQRQALLADPVAGVRTAARRAHHQQHPVTKADLDAGDLPGDVLETCRLDREPAEHLVRHGDPAQRAALAENPHLEPDLVAELGRDADAHVRHRVALRPDLTEQERASIDFEFDPASRQHTLPWVAALHDDPDAMRRLAASAHPLIRRSVARAPHLPQDVVGKLAVDEDRVVQLFLAESCEDAPADMLLRVWKWWTGNLSFPGRPRSHPNFPREGLLRYADDPDPRMRQLALDDPLSSAELVERFSRDTATEVRYRAATDPRLTPASAVRLLSDPERHIRSAALRDHRLPATVLVPLLRDVETADDAAMNPALPPDVVDRMIALSGQISRP
ncbi:PE-PGRS family protein [Streptomyces sp. NPDC101160]|uniref:PE-PGRS family protein n=1 Tax=Streptomyces sp. NPDC101160 TaxID=3366118 RepID=UPI0038062C69